MLKYVRERITSLEYLLQSSIVYVEAPHRPTVWPLGTANYKVLYSLPCPHCGRNHWQLFRITSADAVSAWFTKSYS